MNPNAKNRSFKSAETLKVLTVHTRKQLSARKPIFLLWNIKKGFVKKIETLRASYETLKGFTINPQIYSFRTEPLWVSYEAPKVSNSFTKLIFKFRSNKIGF